MSEEQRRQYVQSADELKRRSIFLTAKVGYFLPKTCGRITWRELAKAVSGGAWSVRVWSHTTLLKEVMALPDSCYTVTKLLPKLDWQMIGIRFQWAKAWHVFWYGTKACHCLQVVVFHNNGKMFLFVGGSNAQQIHPVSWMYPKRPQNSSQSHIGKILALVTTAFAPFDNNFLRWRSIQGRLWKSWRAGESKERLLSACLPKQRNLPLPTNPWESTSPMWTAVLWELGDPGVW